MMSPTANKQSASMCQARRAAGWLALAAAPTFALMGLVVAADASPLTLGTAGASILPVHGMTPMYLLMSLFHLPPWLKLAGGK